MWYREGALIPGIRAYGPLTSGKAVCITAKVQHFRVRVCVLMQRWHGICVRSAS